MGETSNLAPQIQSGLSGFGAVGKDQETQARVNKGMDTPHAHVDIIPWRERKAASYILCASCLDQDCILTKCNRWGDGPYARNGRHAHA
jgi:hypothetical protein